MEGFCLLSVYKLPSERRDLAGIWTVQKSALRRTSMKRNQRRVKYQIASRGQIDVIRFLFSETGLSRNLATVNTGFLMLTTRFNA